jgi:hypothetical protein
LENKKELVHKLYKEYTEKAKEESDVLKQLQNLSKTRDLTDDECT